MKRIRRILLCILMITVLCGISVVGNSVVKSENKSKEKKRTAITKEEMKEWDAPDEDILEYYDLGKFSTTLPVIYMNTKGQQIRKENVICGNIALLDGNEEAQSVSAVPNSIYRAAIKYRGASSYSKFDKKQYRQWKRFRLEYSQQSLLKDCVSSKGGKDMYKKRKWEKR